MKIILRVTGGVTGPVGAVARELDLDKLPAGPRAHADQLVAAARIFERPSQTLLASPRPQDFRYQLEASDGPRSHAITFHLDAVDQPLRHLVDWIEDEVEPVSAIQH
jgi:hypothetical protein